MNNGDPRRGLPSASAIFRLEMCPGSHALIEAIKAKGLFYEPFDPDREAGNRIHLWLFEEVLGIAHKAELAGTELETALKCAELRNELVRAWAEGAPPGQMEIIAERRLWYPSRWNGRFSGQLDFALVDHDAARALVINYKSGRKEAQAAAANLQLRAEVVALKAVFPALESIEAATIEPWVSWTPVRVKYDSNALQEATGELLAIVDRARWDHEHRFAGDHCFFCPARAHCQEARTYSASLFRLAVDQGKGLVELPLGERGSQVIEDIANVRQILKTMESEYKKVLSQTPDALSDHYLHSGKLMRSITNIRSARDRLTQVLSADEFDACLDASVARLEQKFADKKGLKLGLKQQVAEQAFSEYMRGLIEENRGEPYISKFSAKELKRRQLMRKTQEAITQ